MGITILICVMILVLIFFIIPIIGYFQKNNYKTEDWGSKNKEDSIFSNVDTKKYTLYRIAFTSLMSAYLRVIIFASIVLFFANPIVAFIYLNIAFFVGLTPFVIYYLLYVIFLKLNFANFFTIIIIAAFSSAYYSLVLYWNFGQWLELLPFELIQAVITATLAHKDYLNFTKNIGMKS